LINEFDVEFKTHEYSIADFPMMVQTAYLQQRARLEDLEESLKKVFVEGPQPLPEPESLHSMLPWIYLPQFLGKLRIDWLGETYSHPSWSRSLHCLK